jgi:nicotinamide-nucleotide amidase
MQEGVLYAVIDDELLSRAAALLEAYRAKKIMLATAESCTGGLVAGCLTEIAGSSDVVERGFVTYSNEAKTEMLGVPADLIRNHGAVSEEVARAMADGALAHARADVAVSITGIAGPDGATPGKPVGLVHFGLGREGHPTIARREIFDGDRQVVRRAAVMTAFDLLQEAAEGA